MPQQKMRFLALLRGINVGGKNIIPKDDLRQCFEELGFTAVRTYIQSGNVLFRSDESSVKALNRSIESALSVRFGYEAQAVVFSRRKYRQAVASTPADWGKDDARKHNVLFTLEGVTPRQALKPFPDRQTKRESVAIGPGVIFYFFILVLSSAWSWTGYGPALASDRQDRPNILIILADDMGYGDPRCFNEQSKIPTPNIDRLAAEGMRFTDAHAPGSVCHPSRYGLLTGRYPFRTELPWRRKPCIASGRTTVASLLKAHGYRTAMVGKWHLGFEVSDYEHPPTHIVGGPADRGFDTFFGIPASTDIPPYYYIQDRHVVSAPTNRIEDNRSEGWSPIQGAFWRAGGIAPGLKLKDVLPEFTDRAIELVQAHRDRQAEQPLFLYLAFPSPHTPWLPAPEFKNRSGAGLYGDFATMVDHMIGRVLATLDRLNMTDDTLVFFTSDNGPVWYDTDVERWGHDSTGPWRGMKGDAWEAGHRMPFVVRWPDRVAASSESSQTICHTDLLATVADVIGADLPVDAGEDSFSILPELLGRQGDRPIRPATVTVSSRGVLAIRRGRWKLIDGLGSGGFSPPSRVKPKADGPRGQLYDLSADPGETRNLWSDQPEIVEQLAKLLHEYQEAGRSR